MLKLRTGTKAIFLLIIGILVSNLLFVSWYNYAINEGQLIRENSFLSYKTLSVKQPRSFKHIAINGNLITESPASTEQINWRPRFEINMDAKEQAVEIPAVFGSIFNSEVRSDTLYIKFFSSMEIRDIDLDLSGKYSDRQIFKVKLLRSVSLTSINARLYLSKASPENKEVPVDLYKSTLRVGEVDLDQLKIRASGLSKLRTDSGCHIKNLTYDLHNSNIYLYPRSVSNIGARKMDKQSSIGIINSFGGIDPMTVRALAGH